MVANRKLKAVLFLVIILIVILGLSLFFVERTTKKDCKIVQLFNRFISGEPPSSLSSYCDKHFNEDDCRIYFYDFILYRIRNNNFEILDPSSPHLQTFMKYLNKYQPQVIDDMDVRNLDVAYNFRSGMPLEDPQKEYIGLNAAITKNSSYCNLKKGKTEKSYCIEEVKFLNAVTIEDCKNIRKFHLRLLCLKDTAKEEYLAELNRCKI